MVAEQSVTSKIAHYLYRLLRSFVDRMIKSKTFQNEADFMQKLLHYTHTKEQLRSTTLFCTIQIMNFYSLASHSTMIDVVIHFLQENMATNKLENVSIIAIENLLQLFLYNNIFCYKKKIYTLIKGGPNTMPLSHLLSTIYLFQWQRTIAKEVEINNELFGR
jgi:hypothetical protein